MSIIEDVAVGLATMGFRRIVFLNGHYDNTLAIAYACANAAARLPDGARAFPVNYWDGMTADEAGEFFGPTAGSPRQQGRDVRGDGDRSRRSSTSTPRTRRCRRSPRSRAPPPCTRPSSSRRRARSIGRRHSGTWGDARESSAEYGERYLQVVTEATVRMLDDVERTFEAMPPR